MWCVIDYVGCGLFWLIVVLCFVIVIVFKFFDCIYYWGLVSMYFDGVCFFNFDGEDMVVVLGGGSWVNFVYCYLMSSDECLFWFDKVRVVFVKFVVWVEGEWMVVIWVGYVIWLV